MFQVLSTVIIATIAGTLLRWGIAGGPWGLLLVNAVGSLIAGFGAAYGKLDPAWSTALLVGFCGSLTTFSGFALQLVRMFDQGEIFKVALHFSLNNALCLLMCYSGWLLAHKS